MKTPSQNYSSLQPFVKKEATDVATKITKDALTEAQFKVAKNSLHVHNGVDSPQISPKNLLPFTILTSVPSYQAPQGTWVFVYTNLGSGLGMYLYVMFNGAWTNLNYHL